MADSIVLVTITKTVSECHLVFGRPRNIQAVFAQSKELLPSTTSCENTTMLKQTVQRSILLAGITLVSLSSAALSAKANNPGAQKWETEIAAFEAAKRQRKYHYAVSGHARQTRSTACIRRSAASLACRVPA
jgi:hypothetical protein